MVHFTALDYSGSSSTSRSRLPPAFSSIDWVGARVLISFSPGGIALVAAPTSNFATHTATTRRCGFPICLQVGPLRNLGLFVRRLVPISAWVSTRIFRGRWPARKPNGRRCDSAVSRRTDAGWIAGWQVVFNMLCAGWVGIPWATSANGFGWLRGTAGPLFSGLLHLAMTSGYWGVIIADVQQGITCF